MKRGIPVIIGKRDGHTEAFCIAKVKRCLGAAMSACSRDARFADPLAQAVQMHLEQWTETRPPTSNYIFRCLRSALVQTGMPEAAEELLSHRQIRSAGRCGIRVYDSAGRRSNGEPWRKAALVNTLQARYGLRRPTARILAREIETRVLALDYPLVSTALINELMRNELLAWGFDDNAVEPAHVDRSPNPVAGGPPPGRED
ncbi:MAG: hypothetical protein IH986_01430 [Planctomycetes bacterium]|nr:hypothetical protein [Planctomycetota bacterium]